MKRTLIGIVLATAFIGAGWSIGKAQSKVADFEIAVDWPPGTVVLTCNRGCDWELNLKKDAHDIAERRQTTESYKGGTNVASNRRGGRDSAPVCHGRNHHQYDERSGAVHPWCVCGRRMPILDPKR